MAHIIITGATGRAGSAVLAQAIKNPAISRISVLSRRPVKIAENVPKANVIIHKDFTTYPSEVLSQLQGASGCVWALGISALGMSEDEYTKVTYDSAMAAAKAFSGLNSNNFNFVFMSGEGANVEGNGQLFARVKGRTEKALLELEIPTLSVFNIRPGGIMSKGEFLAERKRSITDYGLDWLGSALEVFAKNWVIGTDVLAEACLKLALGDGKPVPEGEWVEMGGRLIRNPALRRIGGAK